MIKKLFILSLSFIYSIFYARADMPDSEYIRDMVHVNKFIEDRTENGTNELIRYVNISSKNLQENNHNWIKLYNETLKALKNKEGYLAHIKNKIVEYSETDRPGKEIRLNSYFVVLKQIKTADCVQLLGGFLYDDRNSKPIVKWEPGMDVAPNDSVSNSGAAARALQSMGIKNPPQTDHRGYPIIDSWKLWFEQVKAGTRTFSFEGEKVAYRMKNDGTFETLAASAVSEKSQRVIGKQSPTQSNSPDTSTQKTTWIVFSTMLVLLAALYYTKFRRISG